MSQTTLAFAHRGWHLHHVENSIGALDAAYSAGCDGVEFDVQLSGDGVPVLFHDDDLLRLAGRPERVCDLKWQQLRDVRLSQNGRRASIPALEEFLGLHGQKPFYLELKIPLARQSDKAYCERLAMLCVDAVRRAKPHAQTFLASFHIPLMRWLQSTGPRLPLGMIYEDEGQFESVLESQKEQQKPFPWLHSLEAAIWKSRTQAGKPLPLAKHTWLWGLQLQADMERALAEDVGGLVVDDVPALMRLVGRT